MAARKAKTIDWASYEVARGSAKRVGTLLAALSNPAKSGEAIQKLGEILVLNGRAYSAASPAVAELLKLVADPVTPARAEIVRLLQHVYLRGVPPKNVAGELSSPPEDLEQQFAPAAILALLDDQDPLVRARAASLIALLPHAESIDALLRRLASEENVDVRSNLVIAAAQLARRFNHPVVIPPAGAVTPVARALAERVVTSELESFFLWVLDHPGIDDADGLRPWTSGPIDNLAFAVFEELSATDVAVTSAAAALVQRPGLRLDHRARIDWPNRALARFFRPVARDRVMAHDGMLTLDTLNADQRRVLTILSSVFNGGDYLEYGFTNDLRARRRALGLAPRGVLEIIEQRDGNSSPRWLLVQSALQSLTKVPREDRPRARDWLEPRVGPMSALEWMELWTEVEAHAYDLHYFGADQPAREQLATLNDAEAATWSQRYAKEVAATPDVRLRDHIGTLITLPIVRTLGARLPAMYDDCISLYGEVREVFAHLPMERRERIVARRLADAARDADIHRLHAFERVANELLDLVPRATEMILDRLATPSESWNRVVSGGVERGFARFRAEVPEVERILTRYGFGG